jgi:dTDP-4-amino-4,6-dideoxygalactose transaminase
METKEKHLIRLSKTDISKQEINSVINVLKKGYLGMGDEVNFFESELSNYLGRDVACVVNGTAALQLALQACNIGKGDEVLIPSLTYVASYQAIIATGAMPVSCDVNGDDLIISISDARNKITNNTKAIMPVFFSGGVGDLEALYSFAKEHKLRVIEDAAHAFGSRYKNQLIGSFGDVTCFSFDGIKNISSGEGGCIVTNDPSVMDKVKNSRLLGVIKDTENRYAGNRSWEFDVTEIGWRYHMSNIMASIGITQLKRINIFTSKRQALAKLYDSLFKDNDYIQPLVRDYNNIVPHIYVVRIEGLVKKNELRDSMLKLNIQTGSHYQPNHLLSLFNKSGDCPITEKVSKELISLPLHTSLTKKQVKFVASSLISLLNNKIFSY